MSEHFQISGEKQIKKMGKICSFFHYFYEVFLKILPKFYEIFLQLR